MWTSFGVHNDSRNLLSRPHLAANASSAVDSQHIADATAHIDLAHEDQLAFVKSFSGDHWPKKFQLLTGKA